MDDNEKMFYNSLLSSDIELNYEKVNPSYFEDNDDLKLTIEDIDNLSIIFTEKSQ